MALNLLQRMSGIATATRRYVDAVAGTRAVILDTRKTVPGLRVLDKWAVRLGGGRNHRIGLYDMALIKDNHIAAVGSITEAVRRVREGDPRQRPIEVEVTDLDQLREALALPIDRILLDNMSHEMIAPRSSWLRERFRWRHRATSTWTPSPPSPPPVWTSSRSAR